VSVQLIFSCNVSVISLLTLLKKFLKIVLYSSYVDQFFWLIVTLISLFTVDLLNDFRLELETKMQLSSTSFYIYIYFIDTLKLRLVLTLPVFASPNSMSLTSFKFYKTFL